MPARDAWRNADDVAAGAVARGTSVIHYYEHPSPEQPTTEIHPALSEIGTIPLQRTVTIDLASTEED